MRKLFASMLTLSVVAGAVVWGTGAFFSDTETSNDNTFTAGGLDLKIDSQAHYNDMVCVDGTWQPEVNFQIPTNHYPEQGSACSGSWALTDLVAHKFFDFADVKPGDMGENTISLHVENNDAWACVDITNVRNTENTLTDPESQAGDTLLTGELAQNMQFYAWIDDGDNVLETGEFPLTPGVMSGSELLNGDFAIPLAAPDVLSPLPGGQTKYVGVAWCVGKMSINETTLSIACDGNTVTNNAQTDSLIADVSFRIEQARNNPDFSCGEPVNSRRVGAVLGAYTTPTPEQCSVIVTDADSLQEKINGAADHDVVCVEDGSYNEFVVNKPLTIMGLVNPNTGSAKVVPSTASVNYLASIGSSDVTISGLHFDGTGTDFTGSQTAGVHIGGGGAVLSNVNVSYNIIENLRATGASASNKGIQFHDGSSSGSPSAGNILSNSFFTHNVINNITADNKGAYGVQTVGELNNVIMSNNTISNVTGAWGAGVAIDAWQAGEIADVEIINNHIMEGIWSAPALFTQPISVQVEHNPDPHQILISYNNLEGFVHGGGGTEALSDLVNATHNWWGDDEPLDDFFGHTNINDYATSPFAIN